MRVLRGARLDMDYTLLICEGYEANLVSYRGVYTRQINSAIGYYVTVHWLVVMAT